MNNPINISQYWREYPHKVLQALNPKPGFNRIVGDSRLGHSLISAGRPVLQDLEVIDEAINNRTFFKNQVLKGCFNYAKKKNSNIHLLGMISEGGIHSHLDHLLALLEMANRENFDRVYIDAITDGTDSEPMQALEFIEKINLKIRQVGLGKFSSVAGRKYAMDRDHHWDRTIQVFKMLVEGNAPAAESIEKAITQNYKKGLEDGAIEPTLIKDQNVKVTIKPNDVILFFNFRPDRARQLTEIFVNTDFRHFFWKPQVPVNLLFSSLTKYSRKFNTQIAFPRKMISNILPEVLSKYHKNDLRIAESEKKAHVTYFFNCGREEPFKFETCKIFASPDTDNYDQTPAMSGRQITQAAITAIGQNTDFILINFANVDLIAHTGNIIAAGQAVLKVDLFVKEIVESNLRAGGATIITADHGNVEQMVSISKNVEQETHHTFNPVPFILIAKDKKKNLIQGALSASANTLSKILSAKNTLADVAPTVLEIMNLPKPAEMTGHSLLRELE